MPASDNRFIERVRNQPRVDGGGRISSKARTGVSTREQDRLISALPHRQTLQRERAFSPLGEA